MRITSYAHAFPRDRRIYRIDRWTVPIPGGLPLKASAWFIGIAIAVIALAQLPGVHQAVSVVGWPAAVLIGPGAMSIALTRPLTEGRTAPAHALCAARWHVARFRSQRSTPTGATPVERLLTVACDHTMSTRVRIHGPGRVALDGILNATQHSATVIHTELVYDVGRTPYLVELAIGQLLEVGS